MAGGGYCVDVGAPLPTGPSDAPAARALFQFPPRGGKARGEGAHKRCSYAMRGRPAQVVQRSPLEDAV